MQTNKNHIFLPVVLEKEEKSSFEKYVFWPTSFHPRDVQYSNLCKKKKDLFLS